MSQPPSQRQPQKPASLDPIAVEILAALLKEPAATEIVLGGYFALKHYVDYIDQSLYPEAKHAPTELLSREAKADYVHRVCSAWDFRIHPEPETFALLKKWRDILDDFPLPASPAYHASRCWFGWSAVPAARPELIAPPHYQVLDQLEGRPPDPCEQLF